MFKKHIIASGHRYFLNDPNLVKINWRLTHQCNYRCPYCFMMLLPDATEKRTIPNVIPFNYLECAVSNLNNIYQNKAFDICFTGGEPTFLQNFLEAYYYIITHLNNVKYVRLHTNLSMPLSFWREFVDLYRNNQRNLQTISKIDIECTMHLDFINNKETLNEYLEKTLYLESCGLNVNNTIMINKRLESAAYERLEKIKGILKNPTQLKLTVNLHDGKSDMSIKPEYEIKNPLIFYLYDDNSLEIKTQNEIVSTGTNCWLGMICNIGRTMLNITPEGIGSWTEYPERCTKNFQYYDLYKTEINKTNFPPIICQHRHCIHPGDFQILKLDGIRYQQWIKYGTFTKKEMS